MKQLLDESLDRLR
jgi:hypothetical protein